MARAGVTVAERAWLWRSVTPTPFTNDDVAVWRDGKPRCATHPYKCLVRATLPGLVGKCDGGTHVCPDCMRAQLDAKRGEVEGGRGDLGSSRHALSGPPQSGEQPSSVSHGGEL